MINTYTKMLDIFLSMKPNQKHSEVIFHTHQDGYNKKDRQVSVGNDVEK